MISSSYREISLQLPHTGDRKRSTYKTPGADRECNCCDVIKDEKQFLLICDMYMPEREYFFQKISSVYDGFTDLNHE